MSIRHAKTHLLEPLARLTVIAVEIGGHRATPSNLSEERSKQWLRMKWIAADGRVSDPPFAEAFEGQPRQQLQKLYLREGSIYLTRRSVLMEQNSIKGNDCRAWIIPSERALNIDTPLDLLMTEQVLKSNGKLPAHT